MTGLDMSLQEAMSTQRAVRRIKPDPVDDALVLRLIELAQKAPTQQDTQAWEFIVVKDAAVKARLARQNRRMWRLYRPVAARMARQDPKTERIATWMHALRAQLLRSPAVVSVLMQHGHYAPALLRATNVLLSLLREAGFDGPDAVRASREIMWSTLGFVSAEIRGPTFSPSFYAQALHVQADGGTDDVSEVAAHMPYLLTRDLDEVFAAIVRHLLAGLATDLAERTASPARRSGRA